MTDSAEDALIRVRDLKKQSERRHMHVESFFLNEEELASVQPEFPESEFVRYDGGYEGARKKKVIFLRDEEDDFSDVVCLQAHVDQRFRRIGHRDMLGAVLSLQVERSTFGDFWLEDDMLYFYTEEEMADFFIWNLTKINQLNVHLERTDSRPVQHFRMRSFTAVAASERADALVAALAHVSRARAAEMIRMGMVSLNHEPLAAGDEVCDNNVTISIRGTGRFIYLGYERKTKAGRIAAQFQQYI